MSIPTNDAPAWADVDATAADAARSLRLRSTDPDYDRVTSSALAAVQLIDEWLDRAEGDELVSPPPEPVTRAATQITVELFRRKDTPFGILDSWSADATGPVRIGNDPIRQALGQLVPYRTQWGIA